MARFLFAVVLLFPRNTAAYSVLTHEAIIDSAWQDSLLPTLLQRFPHASASELRDAHAAAYGGAIIQDLGYYPSGNHLFSDLTHYIQSGQFVMNMIQQSRSVVEYAFALGSLAHYAADRNGHAIGINRAVPLLYPNLARKFGPSVTYGDDASSHLRTEFAFDVVQVAHGLYAPEAYHDFIGFVVSKDVLERAFEQTYCLSLRDLFDDIAYSLSTYRHTVSGLIPRATKVAWALHKHEIQKQSPGVTRSAYVYTISRGSYEKEWGGNYERPGWGSRILAFLLKLLPKVGPLRTLAFKVPTAAAEDLFMRSFDATVTNYRALLGDVRASKLHLQDINFDTGKPAGAERYRLADAASEDLRALVAKKGCPATPGTPN